LSRRRTWLAAAAIAVVVLIVLGLRGLGRDSTEQAIYALGHAVEHGDAGGACERVFAAASLPPSVADDLDIASSARSPRPVDQSARDCARELTGEHRAEVLPFEEPLVDGIQPIPVRPAEGITRAAAARVRFDLRFSKPIVLVEHEGDWKVLVEGRSLLPVRRPDSR
jgi:hypothetical protein